MNFNHWENLEMLDSFSFREAVLEIGGPSSIFEEVIPIYRRFDRIDNVNLTKRSDQFGHDLADEFTVSGKVKGKTYIDDASVLQVIKDKYDFIASSHVFEHLSNPIQAVKNWQTKLQPNGKILFVLPDKDKCFDRNRETTELEHFWRDFYYHTEESDLSHVDEVVANTTAFYLQPSREALKPFLLNNYEHRAMHHHTFTMSSAITLFQSLTDFEILQREFYEPYNICILIQQKF